MGGEVWVTMVCNRQHVHGGRLRGVGEALGERDGQPQCRCSKQTSTKADLVFNLLLATRYYRVTQSATTEKLKLKNIPCID